MPQCLAEHYKQGGIAPMKDYISENDEVLQDDRPRRTVHTVTRTSRLASGLKMTCVIAAIAVLTAACGTDTEPSSGTGTNPEPAQPVVVPSTTTEAPPP